MRWQAVSHLLCRLTIKTSRRHERPVGYEEFLRQLEAHLDDDSLLAEPGIRLALAAALFRERSLSLGQAARFSRVAIAEFIQRVSQLGIPVVDGTPATVREDTQAVEAWRNGSSRPTRAH